MLKLFLLRHAQAAGSYDVDDYQRPLTTPHGIQQAQSVALSLPPITLAICSAANRTRMTLDSIETTNGIVQQTKYSDDIYNGSAGDLLSAIQECGQEETLLIIAHNPGIHQLANVLASEDGSKDRELLRYDYAPATLSILECPIENWAEIKPSQNKLVDLVIPE